MCKVVTDYSQLECIQCLIDKAPKARLYYSDGFEAYSLLWYHFGRYKVSVGKTDTFSVEGDNAEFRHYLTRLAIIYQRILMFASIFRMSAKKPIMMNAMERGYSHVNVTNFAE